MTTSLLDQLADDVYSTLADDARVASLRRVTSGGLDEYGDPLPGTVDNYPCRAWLERKRCPDPTFRFWS